MNLKNSFRNFLKKRQNGLLSFFLYVFYRALSLSWRLRVSANDSLSDDLKNKRPIVFALWHGDELAMIPFCKFYSVVTMTSISSDGQLIDSVIRRLGIRTSKGSSSKKAIQGLKGLIRLSRQGHIPVVPVDGPKGPIYQPKPGVFELSKILGAKIYPGAIACSSKTVFKKSWNQIFLPHPFSRVCLFWGPPLPALSRSEDPRNPDLASTLAAAINAAGQSARKEIARLS